MTHPQKTSGPRGVGPGIKNEDPPFGNFYIRTQGGGGS